MHYLYIQCTPLHKKLTVAEAERQGNYECITAIKEDGD